MTSPAQAAKARANQAAHYNAQQTAAAARGPMHLVGFWAGVCRKKALDALENGDPSVANALSAHLHDFYQRYNQ